MNLDASRPIEIGDKARFDEYLVRYPQEISEFTFTNLFIWRKYYEWNYLEHDGHLILFSMDHFKKHGGHVTNIEAMLFFPPIGPDPEKMIVSLFETLDNVEVHRCPKHVIDNLRELDAASNLLINEDRGNWDYLYEKNALIALTGSKYYQKRKRLKRFLQNHDSKFELVTENLLDKCKELQLEWCVRHECDMHPDLEEEQRAIYELFDNYQQLNVKGGLILVDETCIAYTFGEKLNEGTFVIHVEKAHTEHEGSYQAINNLFLKEVDDDSKFVNREQDLDDPGLRQAKMTYQPARLIEKSIIYEK